MALYSSHDVIGYEEMGRAPWVRLDGLGGEASLPVQRLGRGWERFRWGSVFLVPVPIMILLLDAAEDLVATSGTTRAVPRWSRQQSSRR